MTMDTYLIAVIASFLTTRMGKLPFRCDQEFRRRFADNRTMTGAKLCLGLACIPRSLSFSFFHAPWEGIIVAGRRFD
jgi:hypothetical protein